jgi:hypothetical protein
MKRFSFANIILGLAFLVCAAVMLSAQTTEGGVPVHTVVTVEPHHGSNPPVINREDVMVFEGHNRDTVTDWIPAQGDHADLEFFVLLDDGSSMSLGTQLEDIRRFINELPSTTKIGLAYMQNGIARIAQNLTSDHALVSKALRLPLGEPGINASPYFALSDLVKHWPPSSARREVLMVTDGIDRYYDRGDLQDPYLIAAIEDAQRAGIVVSAIYNPGIGHSGHSYWETYWGQLYLAELADDTGGEGYYIGFNGPPVAFAPYLDSQMQRLAHQYLLTFLAKPPKKAGMQRVQIKTEVPNVDLVAPKQVYVSAGQ